MTVYHTSLPTHGVANPNRVSRKLDQVVRGNQSIDSLREAQLLLSGYDSSDRLKQIIENIISRIPEFTLAEWAAINSTVTLALVQRLKELDLIVGDSVPVAFERLADGTLVATYRRIAQPESEGGAEK